MCYDLEYSYRKQLETAHRIGAREEDLDFIRKQLGLFEDAPLPHRWHLNGFAHPILLITGIDDGAYRTIAAYWGLIPSWVRNEKQAAEISRRCINCRSETMFDKPSFRDAAHHGRCVLTIPSFFEHHHFNGKAYPFNIYLKDKSPLHLACLFDKWLNKATGELVQSFTIVTVEGKGLMSRLHNNPKIKEPRMPLILPETMIKRWLAEANSPVECSKMAADAAIAIEGQLQAHPVAILRGGKALGDVPEVLEPVVYEGLSLE